MQTIKTGYSPGVIGRIIEMHGTYYNSNWNFGIFFEAKVATELSGFMNRFNENGDGLWIVEEDGKTVGSIVIDGIKADSGEGAHLRWFIIDPLLQGKGWGRRLMSEAVSFCDRKGYSRVHLWTFEGLSSARHLYESFGFKMIFQQKGMQWGTIVTEQHLERCG